MWSRLGSNQRPPRCERDALPLSHGTEPRRMLAVERDETLTRTRAEHESPGCHSFRPRRTRLDSPDRAPGRQLRARARARVCVRGPASLGTLAGRRPTPRRPRNHRLRIHRAMDDGFRDDQSVIAQFRRSTTLPKAALEPPFSTLTCRFVPFSNGPLMFSPHRESGNAEPELHRRGRNAPPERNADVAQLVAHHLAKVRVAGSNPVIRSRGWTRPFMVEWPSGEATACKAVHTGSIPVSTSRD